MKKKFTRSSLIPRNLQVPCSPVSPSLKLFTSLNYSSLKNTDGFVEKLEDLYFVGGNVKWYSHVGNSTVVPQNIKNRITVWSSNSTPGYTPQRIESKDSRESLTLMFRAALVTRTKRQKQHKSPSTDKWTNIMWYIYYYSDFKKKGNCDTCYNKDEPKMPLC